ncbi:MAG: hypothetical protein IKH06_05950, partial [Clostridiales bacterium]|nr:hypothetical protein [Clostridiales bacterium]
MKIVNLRTRDAGVTLRFCCDGYALSLGDAVMIDTELGEEIKEVGEEKTFFVEAPLRYENGKVFSRWTGDGIIFTDDTRALVAVTKDITVTAETMDFGKDLLENRPCKANILHEGFNNP